MLVAAVNPEDIAQANPIDEAHVLSADDIDSGVCILGTMIFLFSSYGAGTPKVDDFPRLRSNDVDTGSGSVTPRPFVNRLAQRLLSREACGALAVIGLVGRAWTPSLWNRNGGQIVEDMTFVEVFERLLRGQSVGLAMRPIAHRHAELASELGEVLESRASGREVQEGFIGWLWAGLRETRNYIVLGDPAVHLSRHGRER